MSLKTSYSLIAPFYDIALERSTRAARQASLKYLPARAGHVLINGVGTGLDLPLLPPQHNYTGIDLTAGMLRRALPRANSLRFSAVQGDAQQLPFASASFDQIDLFKALWISCEDKKKLDAFLQDRHAHIAHDKEGRPVFLAESAWLLQMAKEKFPDIQFHVKSEF